MSLAKKGLFLTRKQSGIFPPFPKSRFPDPSDKRGLRTQTDAAGRSRGPDGMGAYEQKKTERGDFRKTRTKSPFPISC